jgi:hypothetical protein
MEHAMTKSKILAATVAAVTLTGAVLGTSAPAFAWHHHHHGYGPGLGIGLAIGTIAAAAAASNAYEPVYECYYQKRYNRWGHRYYVKVCERD